MGGDFNDHYNNGNDSPGYAGDDSSNDGNNSDGSGGLHPSPPRVPPGGQYPSSPYPAQGGYYPPAQHSSQGIPYPNVTYSQASYSNVTYSRTPYTPQTHVPGYNNVPPTSQVNGVGTEHVSRANNGYGSAPEAVTLTPQQRRKTVRPSQKQAKGALKSALFTHSTHDEAAQSIMGAGEGLRSSYGGSGGAGDSLLTVDPDQSAAAEHFKQTSRGKVHLAKGENVPESYEDLHRQAGHTAVRLDVYPSRQMRERIQPDQYDTRSTSGSEEGSRIPAAYNTGDSIPVEHLMQRLDINVPAINSAVAAGTPLAPEILKSVRDQYPRDSAKRELRRVQDDVRDSHGQPRLGNSSSSGARTSSSDEPQTRAGHKRKTQSDREYAQPHQSHYPHRRSKR